MLSSSDLSCSSSVLPLDPFFSCSMSRMILIRIFLASLNVHALSAYSNVKAYARGAEVIGPSSESWLASVLRTS